MSKVEIVGARRELDDISRHIQALGLIHLEEAPLAVQGAPDSLHRIQLTDAQKAEEGFYRDRLDGLRPALDMIKGGARPSDTLRAQVDAFPAAALLNRTVLLGKTARALLRRERNLQDDLEIVGRYEKVLRRLEPTLHEHVFADDLLLKGILIEGDAKATLAYLNEQLKEITGGRFELYAVKADGGRRLAVLAIPADCSEPVATMLWRRGVSELSFPPGFDGLPLPGKLSLLAKQAERLPKRMATLQKERTQFVAEHGEEVLALGARCATHLERLARLENLVRSECTFMLHGWVPRNSVSEIREQLTRRYNGRVVLEELETTNVHRTDIPVQLKNNRFFRPFELLLSIFPLPTYGTLDPTKLLAIGFPLFFGFILGDAGYGLLLLLLSLGFRRKFRHNPLLRDAGFIAATCAGVTIALGLFFGEAFGDLPHRLFPKHHFPFARTEDAVRTVLMAISIGIGAFHIGLSLALGIWAAAKEKATRHLLERSGLMLWFLSLMVAADLLLKLGLIGFGWPVAGGLTGVGVTLIVIGHAASLIELMSVFTNVLSYVRLFAFAMASVALADLANDMPRMVGSVFLGLVLTLFLHLMNFALGVFEPTIQSLRLHYVEFLPKFHNPNGKTYKPLRKMEAVS